jgi:hypothetical protein
VLSDSSFIGQLDPRLARPFRVGFADANRLVFCWVRRSSRSRSSSSGFLPEEKLRTQSGLQAQQAQAGAAARTRAQVPDGALDAGGAGGCDPGAGSTDTPGTDREAAEEEPAHGGR